MLKFSGHDFTKKDLKETLELIAGTLVEEMSPVKCSTIRLLDSEGKNLILSAVCGSEEEGREKIIPLENTYAGEALKKKEIIYVGDIKKARNYKMSVPAKNFTSLLSVPIFFKSESLGIAQLYTVEKYNFNEKEKRHAELLAHFAGIVINSEQMRIENLKAMFEISNAISSSKSFEEIIASLLMKTAELISVERSALYLVEKTKAVLKFGYPREKHGLGYEVEIENNPVLEKILRDQKILNIESPADNPLTSYMKELAKDIGINAVLFIPLIIDEEVRGVAVFDAIGEKKYFSEEDVFFASAVVNLAAVTIARKEDLEEESSLKTLGRASAEICHTIRNPLTAIGGFTERIRKKAWDFQIQDYCERINKEVVRLENTLTDVLRFVHQKEPELNLNNIVNILEETVYLEKVDNKIKITLEAEKDLPQIKFDKNQLKSALLDLIRNAKEAIGKNEGEIILKCHKKGKFVCVEISNSGSQIPADIIDNIFNPFFTTKSNGTGLGLANVASVVKKHGGKIEVKSEKNKTTFSMKFPI